jgi:transcription antitermination factor NusG
MIENAWYCIHSKPKCEHIAAALLLQFEGVESYCPRIRFQRNTQRGKVWFTEALFPSYFFARFDLPTSLRAVKYSQNVIRVVEFGGIFSTIENSLIQTIRDEMGETDVRTIHRSVTVGDTVELTEGPMRGFAGLVDSLLSGEDRVRILLDFLGRQTFVEMDMHQLIADHEPRSALAVR